MQSSRVCKAPVYAELPTGQLGGMLQAVGLSRLFNLIGFYGDYWSWVFVLGTAGSETGHSNGPAGRGSADPVARRSSEIWRVCADKPWHSACSFISVMIDGVTSSLERYMDLLSARQKLVASNIANADTPGYKTQDVDFQFEFMTLAKGEQPQTIQAQGLVEKPDGNNVNLDRESRLLSEDQMRFNLASVLVHQSLKTVLEAIQGGGS